MLLGQKALNGGLEVSHLLLSTMKPINDEFMNQCTTMQLKQMFVLAVHRTLGPSHDSHWKDWTYSHCHSAQWLLSQSNEPGQSHCPSGVLISLFSSLSCHEITVVIKIDQSSVTANFQFQIEFWLSRSKTNHFGFYNISHAQWCSQTSWDSAWDDLLSGW